MKTKLVLFLSITLLLNTISCKISLFKGKGETSKSPEGRKSDEDEGLPGYDLLCSIITKSTVQNPTNNVGCNINKKDPTTIITDLTAQYEAPPNITVKPRTDQNDANFKAYYSVSGSTYEILEKGFPNVNFILIFKVNNTTVKRTRSGESIYHDNSQNQMSLNGRWSVCFPNRFKYTYTFRDNMQLDETHRYFSDDKCKIPDSTGQVAGIRDYTGLYKIEDGNILVYTHHNIKTPETTDVRYFKLIITQNRVTSFGFGLPTKREALDDKVEFPIVRE